MWGNVPLRLNWWSARAELERLCQQILTATYFWKIWIIKWNFMEACGIPFDFVHLLTCGLSQLFLPFLLPTPIILDTSIQKIILLLLCKLKRWKFVSFTSNTLCLDRATNNLALIFNARQTFQFSSLLPSVVIAAPPPPKFTLVFAPPSFQLERETSEINFHNDETFPLLCWSVADMVNMSWKLMIAEKFLVNFWHKNFLTWAVDTSVRMMILLEWLSS